MNKRCVFNFLFLLCVHQMAGGLSFISPYQGRTVRGSVRSSLQFNWSFTGDVDLIQWGLSKPENPTILDGNQILFTLLQTGQPGSHTTPAAYVGRVTGSRTNGLVIFTLRKLKMNDARLYVCALESGTTGNWIYDHVQLVVEGPPNIIATSANQTVNEGNELFLNCTVTGNPTPNTTWTRLRDNRVVTMPLTNIRRQHESGYRCTANNGIGNPVSKEVFITVHYKPNVTGISTSVRQDTAIQGQNVTLTCHVTEAKPPALRYRFYHNNSLLSPETIFSKYTIYSVKRSQHYGNYKCKAHNDAGVGESDVILLDIKVPAEIQWLTKNITVNESSAITLTCDATGYPRPSITWSKDGLIKSRSNTLHIQSSARGDSGTYVCAAANGVNEAVEMETFIIVHYQPSITTVIPTSPKQSWIGQSVQLKCVADGSPTPSITWTKPDGTKLRKVTSTENTVDAQMNSAQEFGNYTCEANNIVGAAATRWVQLIQIKPPGYPNLTTNENDIRASSLILRWTAPADDGGSPIIGYNLTVLHGDIVILNKTRSASSSEYLVDSLTKNTSYTLRVSAMNKKFQGPASEKKVMTKYEGVPASVDIIGLPSQTKDIKMTLKWNKPQNNGAPITQYTVYWRIVNDDDTVGRWNKIRVIKDISSREVIVELEKNKVYEFVVTARNEHGDSLQGGQNVRRLEVLGDVPEPVIIVKVEIEDDQITLTWNKPEENGAAITHYSVYKRIANDETWTKVADVQVTSSEKYVFSSFFKLQRGKIYDLKVTATNKYGSSIVNNNNIKTVEVSNGVAADPNQQTGPKGVNLAIIAGAATVGVLLILGLTVFVIWRKRRKTPSETGSATAGLQGPYPDEMEEGYSAVAAPSAAHRLQAGGPVPDVTYAQVDKSKTKKKKTKAPMTDVYAQVDKSKKSNKKRNKQPGELEYAELDDFRPNTQPAPQASGTTTRPLFRAPLYEGTEYADITQFGVPKSEPTYDNVARKKDVVYSNVESM